MNIVCEWVMPMDIAPSNWPRSTDMMPPRTISAIYAPVFMDTMSMPEGTSGESAAAGRIGVAPIYDHGLHHHRRAAENLYINGDYCVKYLLQNVQHRIFGGGCGTGDTCQKADRKSRNRAGERYKHGIAHTCEKLGIVLCDYIKYVSEKAHVDPLSVIYFLIITTRLDS